VIEKIDAGLAVRELMALARHTNGLALTRLKEAKQPVAASRPADAHTAVPLRKAASPPEAAAARM
jgi:hypothetical protein